MAEQNTVEKVKKYLMPILDDKKYELFDIEFVKEGSNWILRVFIDKEGGITIDDCEIVSRLFEKALDDNDPIVQTYILEVSSPGIDRPLKKDSDYNKYTGETIDIKLYKPMSGCKEFQGVLQGLQDNIVTITNEAGEELKFVKADIASCRLAVIF